MPSTGAGPSRRSHTKSRKGCKTCKRRHIRCDETFPQCRNCTKHQVRCDYMESIGSDSESQHSPEQSSLTLTPGSESRIDLWQQTGSFPYPELQVFPPPPPLEYSKTELRLIHHLSSVSNDLLMRGTTNLSIWTHSMSKFLSIAASYPYVMHALLAFSANHLAWTHSSTEARNLHLHHGSVALRGLHEAIGSFSHANADAVLAASLLLLWQATDWRSWSSLRAGIQSVLAAMQSWKHQSLFAEYIAEEDQLATAFLNPRRRSSVNTTERTLVLQNALYALQRLQQALVGQEYELGWVSQLLAYVQQLQVVSLANSAEEQFNYLYQLRKWLFWIPISLLQRSGGQGPAMLTLAHFYATALALEPLFPDLGSSFCSAMAFPPLEAIINVTDAMQSEHGVDASYVEIVSLMQYPRQTALNYKNHAIRVQQQYQQQQQNVPLHDTFSMSTNRIDVETFSYADIGNISPAFAPSTPHYPMSQQQPTPSASSTSSSTTPYLEVPFNRSSFTYGTQSWGALPSPGLPPAQYLAQAEGQQMYDYSGGNVSSGGSNFHGGTPSATTTADAGHDDAEAGAAYGYFETRR